MILVSCMLAHAAGIPQHPRREPYTVATIVTLRSHLNFSLSVSAAIFTCLMTAFYGVTRLREVTTETQKDFSPTVHLAPSNVRIEQGLCGKNVTVFHILCTKTPQQAKTFTGQHRQISPTLTRLGSIIFASTSPPPIFMHLPQRNKKAIS